MDQLEELKKYKELLDQGIITSDEFDKKKREIMGDIVEKPADVKGTTSDKPAKKMTKNSKIIIGLIAGILVIVVGYFAITKISSTIEKNALCNGASERIASTMAIYGLNDYEVIYASSSGTNVLCPEFEKLSSSKKYELIKATMKLSDITVNGQKIDVSCDFYVNSRDYYYYISPLWAQDSRNNYKCGGIYKYDGNRYCIYEE